MTEIDPDPALVVLDGALCIRTIAAVRATLLEALAGHTAVRIDTTGAESVDLSLIQVLLAARRSALEAGKQLTLIAPADGALRAALERGGCLPASGGDPFWSGEA